ncbi:hypothetical protein HPB50_013894 [Hyalomma asiaticum]|uniref:Uncharacterized protein n=1 Tax=Hyalomma asiaticum TaxID=266040 RepID=A0ACB7TJN7_HYAAI|nr:hypothetical protein HPB50_013894 [Hyalomma asiaticum]
MDIVHPDYVEATHLTGECAWIRQVAEKNSICLPIAKVTIEGPFGVLETEAAVYPNLPKQYPYLFSNKSDMLLKKRGLSFGEFIVQAITRSKARELAAERAGEGEQPRAVDPCEQASTSAGEDGSSVTPTGTHNGHFREQRHCSPFVTSSGGGRAVITGKGRTAASRSCAVGVPHERERSPVRCLERSSRCCRTQSASSDGRGTGGAFPTSYKKEGVGSARRCWVFRLLAHGWWCVWAL